jgi:hypothetical protein
MISAVNSAMLLGWEASRNSRVLASSEPTKIIPGERLGNIFLEMNESQVVATLGSPCETRSFEAESLEQTLKVFAYINKETGRNLTAKDAFPLRKAKTYFQYHRFGLDVCFEENRVCSICAYTGVLCGYESKVKSFFPTDQIPTDTAILGTLGDVRTLLGTPNHINPNEYAPVPKIDLTYSRGLSFSGRADDGRLGTVSVMKPLAK